MIDLDNILPKMDGDSCPQCGKSPVLPISQWDGKKWVRLIKCPQCGFEQEMTPPLALDDNPDAFKIGEMGEPEVTPKIHEFIADLEKP